MTHTSSFYCSFPLIYLIMNTRVAILLKVNLELSINILKTGACGKMRVTGWMLHVMVGRKGKPSTTIFVREVIISV